MFTTFPQHSRWSANLRRFRTYKQVNMNVFRAVRAGVHISLALHRPINLTAEECRRRLPG